MNLKLKFPINQSINQFSAACHSAKMANHCDSGSFLENFLGECGLELKNGKAVKVTVDRREFQKRFQAALLKQELTAAAIVDEVRKYFENNSARFENALVTCDASGDSTSQ